MKELKAWLRFSEADAVATMDGLFSRASGNPSLPSWLARPLLNFVFTESGENDKYRAQIDSSAGIAVFTSELNNKYHWVAAGRACQRFALQATSLGLKYAFINQPVEVPNLRNELSSYLGLGGRRPDLVVRFGNGPELPKSLRRPPEQLISVGKICGSRWRCSSILVWFSESTHSAKLHSRTSPTYRNYISPAIATLPVAVNTISVSNPIDILMLIDPTSCTTLRNECNTAAQFN
jgi:hypothetical protein